MILGGHLLIGEVAPAAPVAGAAALAVAGLGAFLAFLVCWGLREAWDGTIGYGLRWIAGKIRGVDISFGWFGDVHPFGFVADVFEAVDKNISHALAVAALNTEHAFTWCFHTAAQVIVWTGHEIAALARDTYHALVQVHNVEIPHALRTARRFAQQEATHAEHAAERYARGQVRGVEHDYKAADRAIRSSVTTVEHELAHTLPRVKTLEREVTGLEKKVGEIARSLSPAVIVALIGATIWQFLPRFFRCPSFTKAGNRLGCFGWSILDDILAGAIDVLVVADLCRFTHLMIHLAESAPIQDTLYGIVNGLDDLIQCQGVGLAPKLSGYWTTPPPSQPFSAIPAA